MNRTHYQRPQITQIALLFFFLLALFLITSLLYPSGPFYEDSIYIYYAESFLKDLDFNIINQVPENMTWMVTENLYHPDHHAKFQTPLISLMRLMEVALTITVGSYHMDYHLASFGASILCTYLGLSICKELGEKFGIRVFYKPVILFFLTSSLFFFSFLNYNVIEIFCFPLMAYLLLLVVKIREDIKFNCINFLAAGMCVAILLITKPSYIFLCTLVLVSILKYSWKTKQISASLTFILGCLTIYLLNIINQYNQFGSYFEASFFFSQFVFDLSWDDFFASLTKGVWGWGGLLNTNPGFLFATLGFLYFVRHCHNVRQLHLWEIVLLSAWVASGLFQSVPIVGYMIDDHLVGRLSLIALPIWILSFSFLYQKFSKDRLFMAILYVSAIWHIFVLLNFICIELFGHYTYVQIKFLPQELWQKAFIILKERTQLNLKNIKYSMIVIVFFIAFLTGAIHLISRSKNKFRILAFGSVSLSLVFLFMTIVSHYTAPGNILTHKNAGLYKEKVVVRHGPILIFDYLIDRLLVVQASDDKSGKEMLLPIVDKYYHAIKSQIVSSNPEFDALLSEKRIVIPQRNTH